MRRSYCHCVDVQNHDYAEAASKLRCRERFLRDNIGRLPHQKLGDSVAFCNCELALIQAMFSVLPAKASPATAATATTPTLQSIRPAQGRRSRAVS